MKTAARIASMVVLTVLAATLPAAAEVGFLDEASVTAWGENSFGQCTVPAGLAGVTQVAGSGWHSLALKTDGSVAAWGYNGDGQCTVPAGLAGVTQVAAGEWHSLALKTDGSVAAWGPNSYGQCTVPAGLAGVTQVAAGGNHNLALKTDGSVAAWGRNNNGQCTVPAGFFLAVAAGGQQSLGLKARETYDDLLVTGTGASALLQRPITVSGDATVETVLVVENAPTMDVAGMLKVGSAGAVTVDGWTITAGGLSGPAGALVRLQDAGGSTALTVGGPNDSTFLGDLGDAAGGSGSLRKTGTGTQTLGGVNSYTGATDIAEGVLIMPQGLGTPGATVTVAPGAELHAAGVVNRPVAGEGAVMATDWLVAGDGGSPTGWNFPGTLSVGANSVLLLDANVAELGALTTLAEGGRLNSFSGARLGPDGSADPTKVLGASGNAVVDGLFTNNGLVNGPTDPGQWLTFEDDVDALGTFTGNIRFKGNYTVGMGTAAFAAATCFEGSTVLVDEGGGLDLDGPTTFERTVTKTGAGILTIDGPQTHEAGALLDILAGTVWLNTDAGGGGDFSVSVTGAELYFGANQHLDTLALDGGALVRFAGANTVVVKHLVMDGIDLGAATLTPEPATLLLLAAGALALLARKRRPARA